MNEKFAHTPGPWHYMYTCIGHTVRQSPDAMSALLVTNVSENPEQDACLISAAPELLEALALLLNEVDKSAVAGARGYGGWPVAVQKSRAAIAKATGKTSEAA